MMTRQQMENTLIAQNRRIIQLEEQLAALLPKMGRYLTLETCLLDMNHAGRFSDFLEHLTKSWNPNIQDQKVGLKAQRAYYIDPCGRVGRDWTIVVTPANATAEEIDKDTGNLAVSGYVP